MFYFVSNYVSFFFFTKSYVRLVGLFIENVMPKNWNIFAVFLCQKFWNIFLNPSVMISEKNSRNLLPEISENFIKNLMPIFSGYLTKNLKPKFLEIFFKF